MGVIISQPSSPGRGLKNSFIVFVALFSVFIAGRIFTVVNRSDQLNESQNTFVFISATMILAGCAVLIGLLLVLVGAQLNKRVRGLSAMEPNAVVVNVDRRHGTGFLEGLIQLGASKFEKANLFAVVGNDRGVDVYLGYRPPKLVVHIPSQRVSEVRTGEVQLGIRSIPRIEIRVRALDGEIELPFVPNQSGWGIHSFSSRERVTGLVRQLTDLWSEHKQESQYSSDSDGAT